MLCQAVEYLSEGIACFGNAVCAVLLPVEIKT